MSAAASTSTSAGVSTNTIGIGSSASTSSGIGSSGSTISGFGSSGGTSSEGEKCLECSRVQGGGSSIEGGQAAGAGEKKCNFLKTQVRVDM